MRLLWLAARQGALRQRLWPCVYTSPAQSRPNPLKKIHCGHVHRGHGRIQAARVHQQTAACGHGAIVADNRRDLRSGLWLAAARRRAAIGQRDGQCKRRDRPLRGGLWIERGSAGYRVSR